MNKFRVIFTNKLSKNIKQYWRNHITEGKSRHDESVRGRLFKASKEKYAQYQHILYSSFVDNQLNDEGFKAPWVRWKQPNLHRRNAASLQHLPSTWHSGVPNTVENLLQQANNIQVPQNWMDDYEFYEGAVDNDGNINSAHGTADPTIPMSHVACSGCGADLHCMSSSMPGFIPKEIFHGRTKKELQTIICQRCHFLKHYNVALDVEVAPATYVDTISKIKDEFALALVMVDLLDFPCSIWPDMQDLLGSKRPIIVVGNKVDLLPRDCNSYLDHIKSSLQQQLLASGFNRLNIKHIGLISAKTGYGIEELITQLHKIWRYKGNVYLLGCTNVGKSSLFNLLLNSDYCRPSATSLVRKATACPWPGTTLHLLKFPILRPSDIRIQQRFKRLLSERAQKAAAQKLRRDQAFKTKSIQKATLIGNIGQTFDSHEEVFDAFNMPKGTEPITTLDDCGGVYKQARWCYDTPGVMHPDQITNLLTTEELLQLQPTQMITPRAVRLKVGMSLFQAGLARLDYIGSTHEKETWIKVFIFSSLNLPITISSTEHADEMYKKYLGTEILGLPCGHEERLSRWPGLMCKTETVTVEGIDEDTLCSDIILSSAGWVGLSIPLGVQCHFNAWTPFARGIHVRQPALIPNAHRLIGKHVRNSLAYNISKPFVFRK